MIIAQKRRDISEYNIKCSSISTYQTKAGYEESRYEFYASKNGEKYYQDVRCNSSIPERSYHFTHCRGCFDDPRYTFKDHNSSPWFIGLGTEKDLIGITNPMALGLSFQSLTVLESDFSKYLLHSKVYHEWTIDPSSSDTPSYISNMKNGSMIKKIRLSTDKTKLLTYQALDKDNKNIFYKVDNTYGKFDDFPIKIVVIKNDDGDQRSETIDVIDFQKNVRNEDFTPAKAGLRYNINVNIQGNKNEPTRYWDGKKLVLVCPNPSEYIKNDKLAEVNPPIPKPVVQSWLSWRWLMIISGAMMTLVAVVFARRVMKAKR